MKKHTLILGLLLSISFPSVFAAEIDSKKSRDIEKLLHLTGALAIGKQMSDMMSSQMSTSLKASRPDIPAELFDALRKEVDNAINESLPAFVQLVIPIYDKYYSHDDIKSLIEFYNTELGRKMIRITPMLMQESMQQGLKWGEALGPVIEKRVIKRFKAEGIDLSA